MFAEYIKDRFLHNHFQQRIIPPICPYKFVDGYKNLFPKHLHDDADRMCRNMFLGMYSVIVEYAQRTEQIKMPSKNCYCDVIQQFK